MITDLRLALRSLRKTPGFTAVVVITLAVGIGANTAIFSIVNGVLLRALPYEEPGRLVHLWEDPSGKGQEKSSVAGAQFADWNKQITTMEGIAAIRRDYLNLTGDGQPERLRVHKVSASYLQILRLTPRLGRGFASDDDQPGREKVVILTDQLWRRHFGGATDVVGRAIRLGGESYSVIGILPAAPRLPLDAEALVPFVVGSERWHGSRNDHRLRVIGRLKPGVRLEQARAEMAAITQRLKPLYPSSKQGWGVTITPMHDEITGAIRPQLWLLFGAVAFVLLIACANVAGLLLARMTARHREMAIRGVLGAGRWRVIRQLLTESVLLSFLGGALGVGLAIWGVRLFRSLGAEILPQVQEVGVDRSALGFALLTCLVTGIVFGLAPALHLARPRLIDALKQDSRTGSPGAGARLRGGLIVAELALALMLLAGVGLLLRTLVRLHAVPAGFDAKSVLAMDVSLDDNRYPAGDQRAAFLRRIVERVESLPGAEAAGTATTLPLSGWNMTSVRSVDRPNQDQFHVATDYDFVSGRFFRALGMTLMGGRVLTEGDDAVTAPRVAVIDETLASKVFPNEDALGRRIHMQGEWWQVVGIVATVRHHGLDTEGRGQVYVPQAFGGFPCSLVVRTHVPPLAMAEAVRRAILDLDPDQPVANVRTLEQIVAAAVGQRRLMLVALGLFAIVAVMLAAIGLYGVMAYSVQRRTREIGIRMALGAQSRDVLLQSLSQGLGLGALGVAVGLVGAIALMRVMSHLLFGVTARDPLTFAGVAVVLLAVALVACWLPARRASRVDPMVALRCE